MRLKILQNYLLLEIFSPVIRKQNLQILRKDRNTEKGNYKQVILSLKYSKQEIKLSSKLSNKFLRLIKE